MVQKTKLYVLTYSLLNFNLLKYKYLFKTNKYHTCIICGVCLCVSVCVCGGGGGGAISSKCSSTTPIGAPMCILPRVAIPPAPPLTI